MPPQKNHPVEKNTESPRCVFSFNRATCVAPSAIFVVPESNSWLISVEGIGFLYTIKRMYNVKVLTRVAFQCNTNYNIPKNQTQLSQ